MKTESPPETVSPAVEMVPFPQIEALPPLPPAPGEQPLSSGRRRVAFVARGVAILGIVLLLGSPFAGGWYHVRQIDLALGDRLSDDSYAANALETYTNSYSLAVWAFLKRGYAIPLVIFFVLGAAISLLVIRSWRRGVVALSLPLAIALGIVIALDLRNLPATVTEMTSHFPTYHTAVYVRGSRPGPMMLVAFGGVLLQIGGTLLTMACLPRRRRVSRPKRQPKRKEQPVGEFQPRGTGEYAVQGATTFPQQAADERWYEGQRDEREQYPR